MQLPTTKEETPWFPSILFVALGLTFKPTVLLSLLF